MPFTITGFGTALCGYSAPVQWKKQGIVGQRPDHDAVECVVAAFFPVIPLRAVHTFNWNGTRYQRFPIRMSLGLLANAYLRYLGFLMLLGGVVGGIVGGIGLSEHERSALWVAVGSAVVFVLGLTAVFGLKAVGRRTRDARLVMGPHPAGSSDPATWSREALERFAATAMPSVGRTELKNGRFSKAMMIARVAAGLGDRDGEALTDEILAHPTVQAALPQLRKEPWRRMELLAG